jgi:hypothetical protein
VLRLAVEAGGGKVDISFEHFLGYDQGANGTLVLRPARLELLQM